MEDQKVVYIQLKTSDIPKYRAEILKEQDFNCAICKSNIKDEKGVSLDHQHKTKKEKPKKRHKQVQPEK